LLRAVDWALRLALLAALLAVPPNGRAAESTPPELVQTLEGHLAAVGSLAFSPNGKMLVSGGGHTDGAMIFWDPATGEQRQTVRTGRESVSALAFSPDGKILASGSDDNTVKLWDVSKWARK
jgi:WD40 repeat protein